MEEIIRNGESYGKNNCIVISSMDDISSQNLNKYLTNTYDSCTCYITSDMVSYLTKENSSMVATGVISRLTNSFDVLAGTTSDNFVFTARITNGELTRSNGIRLENL